MDDLALLRRYVVDGSEDAFRTLLERYVNLVHSAALRQVRDPHLAQEITQAVFVVLARKAGSLRNGTVLAGWLFRTTRFVAMRALRDEQRRQRREQEAAQMEITDRSPGREASWDEIAPVLDEAISHLRDKERHAVLLRYFERREFKEVGRALGHSEDAAKKRVARALEKLRSFLVRRGVALSAAALAGALTEHSVAAAPAGLMTSTFAAATANAGTATTLALVKAAIQAFYYAKLKAVAVTATLVLAVIGTGVGTASLFHEGSSRQFVKLPLENVDGLALSNFPPGRLWGSLPAGTRTYDDVPFDIRMRVQLHGNQDAKETRRYPARVMGIPVKERLARLHVVQGANISERDGTPIAVLRLNYARGDSHNLFVVYGVHTREWWHYPTEVVSGVADSQTTVAWTGRSTDGDDKGATHRMFKTTFDLPQRDDPIESIDCLSLFRRSSLIILAMTGEKGRGAKAANVSPDDTRFRDSLDVTVVNEAGQNVQGVRLMGVAQAANGEITLGKLDDTFSTAGVVPVDFPAGARELQLRVTARGYEPMVMHLKTNLAQQIERRVVVNLKAAPLMAPAEQVESSETAQAASLSVQPAYELKRSGRHTEAVPLFLAALREFPNHSDSYHGLAQALRESGNPMGALPYHDRAIRLHPERYDLYWERGLTYSRLRCFDDAIDDFEACLERNSRFTNAQRALEKAHRSKMNFQTELPENNFVNTAGWEKNIP